MRPSNSDRGSSKKASWRSNRNVPAGGAVAPAGGRWKTRKESDVNRERIRYRLKTAAYISLFSVLLGAFIYYVIYRPRRAPIIAVAVTDYSPKIPLNSWAEEDIAGLVGLGQEPDVSRGVTFAKQLQSDQTSKRKVLDFLQTELPLASPGGPGKDVVLLYMSVHGVVDDQANACLLFTDATPHDTESWLNVRELLQTISDTIANHRRLQKSHIVLLLDPGRVDTDWSLGQVYNGFAAALHSEFQRSAPENLYILNATSPGQTSHGSPEFKGSFFGRFVRWGLQGNADGEFGRPNNQVSLHELASYVRRNVSQNVLELYAAEQTPVLMYRREREPDFSLVYAQEDVKPPEAEKPQIPSFGVTASLWDMYHETAATAARRAPEMLARVESKLLRLDAAVLAGAAYAGRVDGWVGEIRTLLAGLQSAEPGSARHSLPVALATSGNSESFDQIRSVAERWADNPDPLADSFSDLNYPVAAFVAWNWVVDNPSMENLDRALALVDRASGSGQNRIVDTVEILFLRMLRAYYDWDAAGSRLDLLRSALQTRRLAEYAAWPKVYLDRFEPEHGQWEFLDYLRVAQAAGDERIHYWVRPMVDQTDGLRRRAEDLLFLGDEESLAEAERIYSQLVGPQGRLQTALELSRQLAAAFAVRDRAWAELPHLARWHADRRRWRIMPASSPVPANNDRSSAELDRTLAEAIQRVHVVGSLLDRPTSTGDIGGPLLTALEELEERMDVLEAAFYRECDRLRNEAPENRLTLRDIRTVLSAPIVRKDDRRALRARFEKMFTGLDVKAVHTGREPGRGDPKVAYDPDSLRDDEFLRWLTRWEEHPAAALLARSYLETERTDVDNKSLLDGADKNPDQRLATAASFGGTIRKQLRSLWHDDAENDPAYARVWMRRTDIELESSGRLPEEVRRGYAKADRAVRAAGSLWGDLPGRYDTRLKIDENLTPAKALATFDKYHLQCWQTARTLDDFWGPAPARGDKQGELAGTPYFQLVADRYLRELSRGHMQYGHPHYRGVDLMARLAEFETGASAPVVPRGAEPVFFSKDEPWSPQKFSVTAHRDLPQGTASVFVSRSSDTEHQSVISVLDDRSQPRRRIGLDVEARQRTNDFALQVETEPLANEYSAEVVALYRGHLRRNVFPVYPPEPPDRVLAQQFPEYLPPQVTAHGQRKPESAVVIVFDCSGSMASRGFPSAAESLRGILERLTQPDSPYHVGLRIYAHRLRYVQRVARDTITPSPFSGSRLGSPSGRLEVTVPEEDSQLVISFDRHDQLKRRQREFSDFLGELFHPETGLRPWGETPLYHSIVMALTEDFPSATQIPFSAPRHLVVITDGADNIRRLPNAPPAVRENDGLKVQRILTDREPRVHLHVVGYRLSAEDRDALKPLDQLAARTGGGSYPARDPTELVQKLEEALGLQTRKYAVQRVGEFYSDREPVRLGETTTLDRHPRHRKLDYQIKVLGSGSSDEIQSLVSLEGGESLELSLKNDRLVHGRYPPPDNREEIRPPRENIADPLISQRAHYVSALIPRSQNQGRDLTLLVTIQNQNEEEFSPRPEEIWAEIRPVATQAGEQIRPFHFYTPMFLPGTPVPVAMFGIPSGDWPRQSDTAEIDLYFKLTASPAEFDQPVSELLGKSLSSGEFDFTVRTKRGDTQSDPCRVMVTVKYPADDRMDHLRVAVDPQAIEIRRAYFWDKREIVHEFLYSPSYYGQIGETRLQLTPKAVVQHGAVHPQPIQVKVPRDVWAGG